MVQRVIATEAALALIERLKAQHGSQLIFFQSGGCCDGSAPMCYLIGELTPGRYDLLLGEIGGCPFFISQTHYAALQQSQLIIDVIPGNGDTFSLDGPEGLGFITRSRLCNEAELQSMTPPQSAIVDKR